MKLAYNFLAATFFIFAAFSSQAESVSAKQSLIVKTFDGKIFDLQKKSAEAKIVLVNFWAEWCLDCRKEMVILDEIYQEYKNGGALEIIGVSIDDKWSRDESAKFAARFSYPNSMLIDATKNSFPRPDFIPMIYVIKNGEIVAEIDGDGGNLTKDDFYKLLGR